MNEQPYQYLEDFILDDTFRKFVIGEDKESIEKWQTWIKKNPFAMQEFETSIQIMNMLLKTRKNVQGLNTEEALKTLLSEIRKEKQYKAFNISIFSKQWFRIAGIIVLLMGISTVLYYTFSYRSGKHEIVAYNEIIVPLGEKSQIVLSDGTHIWINSSSKLKYPVNFSKKNRTVFLEGEAFFDVAHHEKLPFEVHAPNMNIKVLGTAFNIKNYPGDKKATATVVRGLVSIERPDIKDKAVLLKPNENYVLNTISAHHSNKNALQSQLEREKQIALQEPIINKKVNVEAITSWKDQMLVFSDETLEDVVLKMERWYNVKITIKNEQLKKERYRGKFVNNETIYQVLEAIKYTTPIKYSVKNNAFTIDKPKSND
jgi:transmembrane sensor